MPVPFLMAWSTELNLNFSQSLWSDGAATSQECRSSRAAAASTNFSWSQLMSSKWPAGKIWERWKKGQWKVRVKGSKSRSPHWSTSAPGGWEWRSCHITSNLSWELVTVPVFGSLTGSVLAQAQEWFWPCPAAPFSSGVLQPCPIPGWIPNLLSWSPPCLIPGWIPNLLRWQQSLGQTRWTSLIPCPQPGPLLLLVQVQLLTSPRAVHRVILGWYQQLQQEGWETRLWVLLVAHRQCEYNLNHHGFKHWDFCSFLEKEQLPNQNHLYLDVFTDSDTFFSFLTKGSSKKKKK